MAQTVLFRAGNYGHFSRIMAAINIMDGDPPPAPPGLDVWLRDTAGCCSCEGCHGDNKSRAAAILGAER